MPARILHGYNDLRREYYSLAPQNFDRSTTDCQWTLRGSLLALHLQIIVFVRMRRYHKGHYSNII
jgi:hypothetical protein